MNQSYFLVLSIVVSLLESVPGIVVMPIYQGSDEPANCIVRGYEKPNQSMGNIG
jgi:hypothetical protein